VGGLYRPIGEFYGRGRGLIRRGEYRPGGELGRFNGRRKELYGPIRELGGPARGRELGRGLIRGGEGQYRPGGELGRFDGRERELIGWLGGVSR
jgi:hypothetical protein